MKRPRWIAVVALGAACAGGCEDDDRPPPKALPIATASASASDAILPVLPSAAASSAPRADRAESGLVGVWSGKYEAKKGSVELPPKVKDKTHTGDDGKKAVGTGTLTITVGPEGDVKGRSSGSLGEAAVTGRVDGAFVRASFFPDDPTSANAMTGVLVAREKDGSLAVDLRVAGPDAVLVREASFAMTRKK